MGMSVEFGAPKPESNMIELIHHAIDSGVTFLGTSDFYGPYTNEILIGKALKEMGGLREKVQLASKFGRVWNDMKMEEIRGDPDYIRTACEASLNRLGIECIDLYYVHRIDTRVPIEVTLPGLNQNLKLKLEKLLKENLVLLVTTSKITVVGVLVQLRGWKQFVFSRKTLRNWWWQGKQLNS